MAVWADTMLNRKKTELIRKALDAVVMVAPPTTAIPATMTTGASGDLTIPTGFKELGHHSEDGLTWGRDVEASDITSAGSVDPTRSDIRRITSTLGVTAQETNIKTISAALGIADPTAVPPVSGEVVITEPTRPKARYYRLLGLSVDDADAGEIYIVRLFARAKVTEVGEQTWSDGDEAMVRALTFTAYQDSAAGFTVRHYFGGPGWKALLTNMGFPAAATV